MSPLPRPVALRVFQGVTLLRWLPIGLLLPVLVLSLTDRGLSLAEVGLVLATSSVVVAVLELPTGGLADALGRRPLLLVASATSLVGLTLFAGATTLVTLAFAWGIVGVGHALDSGPLEAWYVDLALAAEPGRELEPDLARAGTCVGLGIGVGALLGGVVGVLGDGVAGLAAVQVPPVAAVAAQAVHLAAVALTVREVRASAPQRGRVGAAVRAVPAVVRGGLGLARDRRDLRALLGAEVLWGVAITSVEILWQPRLVALREGAAAPTLVLGFVAAGGFLANAAGSAVMPHLRRALGGDTARTAMVATLFEALALGAAALVGGVPLLVVAYLLVYVGNGGSSPAHLALLHRTVVGNRRATVVSLNSLVAHVGGLVGSLTLPALAEVAGIPAAWGVAAAVFAVSAPLYLLTRRGSSTEVPAPALETAP